MKKSSLSGLTKAAAKPVQPMLKRLNAECQSGFTLIEMLVVVIIIGVLSAIAAPGWLAFTNRQRVSKVNDAVFSAIQNAQGEAKKKKLTYSVSFKIDTTQSPLVAVYPTKDPISGNNINPDTLTPSPWQKLGESLEIKPGQVLLCSNIDPRQSNKIASATCDLTSPVTITFDYQGILQPLSSSQPANSGIGITARIPNTSTKRCVIIKTFLGAMTIPDDSTACPSSP